MRRVAIAMSTIGAEPNQGHRITELAAVEMNGGTTGKTVHLRITQTAGSGPAETGVPFSEAITRWTQFIAGRPLVVHDYYEFKRFLRAECKRAGLGFDIARDYPVIDTWVLARGRFPRQRHGLTAVIRKLGIESNLVALGALEAARMIVRVADKLFAVDDADPALPPIAATINPASVEVPMAEINPPNIEAQESPVPRWRSGLIAQIGRF